MFTPQELKNYDFQSAGRNAYRAADVDEYLDAVYKSYEQMYQENAELVKKINVLADKLSDFKKDEDNIRSALIEAQRMKTSVLAKAQQEADEKTAEANDRIQAASDSAQQKKDVLLKDAQDRANIILEKARKDADQLLSAAQGESRAIEERAQAEYDARVGTIADERKREMDYLKQVKAESAKVRKELMDTYTMQLELLEFTPDFSEEANEASAAGPENTAAGAEAADDTAGDTTPDEDLDAEIDAAADLDSSGSYEPDADTDSRIDDYLVPDREEQD